MMIWVVLFAASLGAGWLLGHGDAAVNARTAAAAAPADSLLALLGMNLGLYAREKVRLRMTYASPTVAYLGKRLLFAAVLGAGTYALTPVAWSAGSLDFLALAAAVGSAVWLSNLPPRI